VAGTVLGAREGTVLREAKPCSYIAYDLPFKREINTKEKSKMCGKRKGSKWYGEKYSKTEGERVEEEWCVTVDWMVRQKPDGVKHGVQALFTGIHFRSLDK
jgi:hypothetical protein